MRLLMVPIASPKDAEARRLPYFLNFQSRDVPSRKLKTGRGAVTRFKELLPYPQEPMARRIIPPPAPRRG